MLTQIPQSPERLAHTDSGTTELPLPCHSGETKRSDVRRARAGPAWLQRRGVADFVAW